MSVRVVARIRPLLAKELDKDVIVKAGHTAESLTSNVVKIPNPKNESEEFSFTFNSVYDQKTTQEELFAAEVNPTVKSLFQGLDVTIFAYGVTGTGKTHTMRGGMKLADRGVIPRLLSNVFRRAKKMAKDSQDETAVDVKLSYYEIYNDKVFDLLEPPEKRTASGLAMREGKDGKTVVVGLSERACGDVRDFERLYIEANTNRVTAATKLNAHSSRSHAILRVTVTQTTADTIRVSTASLIDLAGSEDNRRTDNGRERLVESAAINKSLFVLSQCIEAISRGDRRVPYRESKMTRILSLGQNNGVTVMILNLAPLRSYHLDTLSSLNVSSRAKRIEVREIENEVVFKHQPPKSATISSMSLSSTGASGLLRQPLRPLSNAHNVAKGAAAAAARDAAEKKGPVKAFDVYTDRGLVTRPLQAPTSTAANSSRPRRSSVNKRQSDLSDNRPSKVARPLQQQQPQSRSAYTSASAPQPMSAEQIEAMVEKKVSEILAKRAVDAESAASVMQAVDASGASAGPEAQQFQISEEVQRRLDALERRIEDGEGGGGARSDGLRLLLQAKQAKERRHDEAALRFYEKALPFFPTQTKLLAKIERLRSKLALKQVEKGAEQTGATTQGGERRQAVLKAERNTGSDADDGEYQDGRDADVDDDSFDEQANPSRASKHQKLGGAKTKRSAVTLPESQGAATPRTRHLLYIVNSGDVTLMRGLHGFGAKKAQDLIDQLDGPVESLAQLRLVPGMGSKTIERAYEGLDVGFDLP